MTRAIANRGRECGSYFTFFLLYCFLLDNDDGKKGRREEEKRKRGNRIFWNLSISIFLFITFLPSCSDFFRVIAVQHWPGLVWSGAALFKMFVLYYIYFHLSLVVFSCKAKPTSLYYDAYY